MENFLRVKNKMNTQRWRRNNTPTPPSMRITSMWFPSSEDSVSVGFVPFLSLPQFLSFHVVSTNVLQTDGMGSVRDSWGAAQWPQGNEPLTHLSISPDLTGIAKTQLQIVHNDLHSVSEQSHVFLVWAYSLSASSAFFSEREQVMYERSNLKLGSLLTCEVSSVCPMTKLREKRPFDRTSQSCCFVSFGCHSVVIVTARNSFSVRRYHQKMSCILCFFFFVLSFSSQHRDERASMKMTTNSD